jgi:hypothetical protein
MSFRISVCERLKNGRAKYIRFMTNQPQRKPPAASDDGGERRGRLQVEPRTGENLLAALSPEHLKACREAAKIAPLLSLQLALLLAQRAKRK